MTKAVPIATEHEQDAIVAGTISVKPDTAVTEVVHCYRELKILICEIKRKSGVSFRRITWILSKVLSATTSPIAD